MEMKFQLSQNLSMRLVPSLLTLLAFAAPAIRQKERNLEKRGDSDHPKPGTTTQYMPSKAVMYVKSEPISDIDPRITSELSPAPSQTVDFLNEETEDQDDEQFYDSSKEPSEGIKKSDHWDIYFIGNRAPKNVPPEGMSLKADSSLGDLSSISPNTISMSSNNGMSSLYYQEQQEERQRQTPHSNSEIGESLPIKATRNSSGTLSDITGMDQKKEAITNSHSARQMDNSGKEEDEPLIGRYISVHNDVENNDDNEDKDEEFFTPKQIQRSPTQIFYQSGSKPPGSEPPAPPL